MENGPGNWEHKESKKVGTIEKGIASTVDSRRICWRFVFRLNVFESKKGRSFAGRAALLLSVFAVSESQQ